MKSIRLVVASSLLALCVLDTPTAVAETTAKPAQAAQPAAKAKAKALYGTWTFVGSETFSMAQEPNESQAKDSLVLNPDGSFRLVMDGAEHAGRFSVDASATWISLTDTAAKETYKFKVIEKTPNSLRIDYRDKDEVHNILIYAMK